MTNRAEIQKLLGSTDNRVSSYLRSFVLWHSFPHDKRFRELYQLQTSICGVQMDTFNLMHALLQFEVLNSLKRQRIHLENAPFVFTILKPLLLQKLLLVLQLPSVGELTSVLTFDFSRSSLYSFFNCFTIFLL